MSLIRSLALAACAAAATACAAPASTTDAPSDAEEPVVAEATGQSEDELALLAPDLRFDPVSVQVIAAGTVTTVGPGGQVKVPCSATAAYLRYRYRNAGAVGAGAHANRHSIGALVSVVTPRPAVAAGAFAFASATLPLGAVPPNVYHASRVHLDSGGVVAESNETNNLFGFYLARSCP